MDDRNLIDQAGRAQAEHQWEHFQRCGRCQRGLPAIASEPGDLAELVNLARDWLCPSGVRLLLASNQGRFPEGIN